jgi:hypothetical protein
LFRKTPKINVKNIQVLVELSNNKEYDLVDNKVHGCILHASHGHGLDSSLLGQSFHVGVGLQDVLELVLLCPFDDDILFFFPLARRGLASGPLI